MLSAATAQIVDSVTVGVAPAMADVACEGSSCGLMVVSGFDAKRTLQPVGRNNVAPYSIIETGGALVNAPYVLAVGWVERSETHRVDVRIHAQVPAFGVATPHRPSS